MRYKLRSSSKAPRANPADGEPVPSTSGTGPSSAEGQQDPPPMASTSSSSADTTDPAAAGDANSDEACSPPKKPRIPHRRRKKSSHHGHKLDCGGIGEAGAATGSSSSAPEFKSDRCLLDMPREILLHIGGFLDSASLLSLLRTCRWLNGQLSDCNPFWKALCTREELSNYQCLLVNTGDAREVDPSKVGWRGRPMHVSPPAEYPYWRRVFLKGLQMRRNIWQSNYEGWRIYANSQVPVAKLTPDLDLNEVKRRMGDYPKLSENDDLKIDWDEKHLVVFHFFRGEGESCTIRVWDISEEPRFLYSVDRGLDCITDKVSVVNGHVVIVPSWPLEARAIVMALDIRDEMREVGKFIFPEQERQMCLDDLWEHTQLRVVKNEALVVCRCPEWHLIVVSLPTCRPLYEVRLAAVSGQYECQQIRSYKHTAMIIFARKQNDTANILVTVDIAGAETKIRSCYHCHDVADVALFTDPEEIYIMKRSGDVVAYDANLRTESIKIPNEENLVPIIPVNNGNGVAIPQQPQLQQPQQQQQAQQQQPGQQGQPQPQQGQQQQQPQQGPNQQQQHQLMHAMHEYQLFVNRKEQICVMQSASEVPQGRHIKVYTYSERRLYTINLDLCRYGMSRDESICIYTNGAFLAAADSKRFAMFNVRTGDHLGSIQIPTHLERTKGKEEKDCMFEQTGLSLFLFDEDKLIAVHDYERSFPAVLDIYKFW